MKLYILLLTLVIVLGIILYAVYIGSAFSYTGSSTLKLVHVIFRHGDRTPDTSMISIYPTDPYKDYKYFPDGLGQLTVKGKKKCYRVGEKLRARYADFLGKEYYHGIVDAYSSSYPRTQVTLQAVLAGLFPANKDSELKNGLKWQPIPYTTFSKEDDTILAVNLHCKRFLAFLDELCDNNPTECQFDRSILSKISKHTGIQIAKFSQLLLISEYISGQAEIGLKLPQWVQDIYTMKIQDIVEHHINFMITSMTKFLAGNLLEKIAKDTEKIISSREDSYGKRVYLYSGHDINVGSVLNVMNNYYNRPPYCSYVAFEIHQIDDKHIVNIIYDDLSEWKPVKIEIPGCLTNCTWDQFEQIISKYYNGPEWCTANQTYKDL